MASNMAIYKTDDGGEVRLSAEDVKRYLVKGGGNVTDAEVMIFIGVCKSNGLDPFANDAYLIKYGDSPAASVLGKDAFTKRADRHPSYDGMDYGVSVVSDGRVAYRRGTMVLPGDTLVGGWCDVYRKDRSHPLHAEVSLKEYSTGKAGWAKMPATMIAKVAKVQALRESFPNTLSGFYDESETATDSQPIDIGEAVVVGDAPRTGTAHDAPSPSAAQEALGKAIRKAVAAGHKASDVKARIAEEYGCRIEELSDLDCNGAVALIESILVASAEGLYEEDVPF